MAGALEAEVEAMAKVYEAVVRIEWAAADGETRTLEPGERAPDIPEASVPWLLEQGLIRPRPEARPSKQRETRAEGGEA